MTLTLWIPGLPITQGSVRAYPGKDGRAYIVQGGSPERRRKLDGWRGAIAEEARTALKELPTDIYPLAGPVTVTAVFGMLKPKAAPKKRRTWPIGARSGDIDKLLRSVLDALTGVIWADDSQVVSVLVTKDYATRTGLELTIEEVTL